MVKLASQGGHSSGTCDEAFAEVQDLFEHYLAEDRGFSAQLSIFVGGHLVVDLAGGPALELDSLTGVYSATKGMAALAIAQLIDKGLIDIDAPVSRYWDEFAAAGKSAVTVRQLLSHQAGLPAIHGRVPLEDVLPGSSRGAARLAAQPPVWRPGTAFGYHALTIGILIEELVLRTTGHRLQDLFEQEIRAPRRAAFFMGLPEREDRRYVPVADVRLSPEQASEVQGRAEPDALQERVFANLTAPEDRSERGVSTNNVMIRRTGPAAIGGVGSARGLAKIYADALPTSRSPIASSEVFGAMAQQHSWGTDRVLNIPNCFGLIFMLPQPRLPFGGLGAFGHDGGGGALAFADATTEIAFGYLPVPMQYPGGADHRALAFARMARQIVERG
jgi:CubicO group peptidase (beta-lactamase class C family)